MHVQQKSIILLLFSSISLAFTMKSKPFVLKSLNVLDINSNYTVLFTLFAGSLYILEIGDEAKLLVFFVIIVFNSIFVIRWALAVLDIFVYIYEKQIFKCCPFLLNLVAIIKKTTHETKCSLSYLGNFARNFIKNMKEYSLNIKH